MKIRIKPIFRTQAEADRLVDVVDVEATEDVEAHQMAVIVRSYPTLKEAKENDGVILDEEFDVQDFLDERAQAKLIAKDQDVLDDALAYLVKTDYTVIKIAEGVANKDEYKVILAKRAEARIVAQRR